MAIPADVQAAIDALDARITQTQNAATNAIQADRARLDTAEARLDTAATRLTDGEARLSSLEQAAQRLRRALRDGRFDDGGTFVDALASALGMSVNDVRAALVWVTQERRKAR